MDSGKGTYIAFDGLCQMESVQSDFRFCSTIERWAAEKKNLAIRYVARQDKSYAVRKSSLRATLESRIREILAGCHNVVVVLSADTRKSGSLLSFEIEEAVDTYGLPLIVTYVDYKAVGDPSRLSGYWPNALSQRINSDTVKAIHIPFNKYAILDAATQFTVENRPLTAQNHYSEYAHRTFRCIPSSIPFGNCRRKTGSVSES